MSDHPDEQQGSRLDTPPQRPGRGPFVDTGWTQEDEDRYQERRQRALQRAKVRRRQSISFVVIVLVVILIGVLGAAINQGVISLPFGGASTAATACPPPPEATAALPEEVSVRVLNATGTRGLAARVSQDLTARGYSVVETGNAPPDKRGFPDSAQIHHGPEGLAEAQSVQVQIPGSVLVADDRADGTVDVLIGDGFAELAPAEEAAAALQPSAAASPPGCVPAD